MELLSLLYDKVITTSEVLAGYGAILPEWFQIINATDKNCQKNFEQELDKGEASAIALALELQDITIILDDYKARKVAIRHGLEITGTLGVIIKAKKKGVIPSILPLLAKLKATNFRLNEELERFAIREAGE